MGRVRVMIALQPRMFVPRVHMAVLLGVHAADSVCGAAGVPVFSSKAWHYAVKVKDLKRTFSECNILFLKYTYIGSL